MNYSQQGTNQAKIIFQDQHLVVCNKPVNLPVHKNDFMPHDAPYLTKQIGQLLGKSVYNVHRLDAKTSGLIVLTFHPETAKHLTLQFERKEVEKKYYALVKGNPESGTFTENVFIKKRGKKKPAITHFKTIESIKTNICYKEFKDIELGLVEINLETGRWHQIRQHFAMHRFDILGDTHHGDWTLNRIITEKTGIKRLFLHAAHLTFTHPVNQRRMNFDHPIPAEFQDVLQTFKV
ncbi:MAG: pseudouridine synthase [Bacteroidales bacterium]|jgi:tRNA pseudouridine65 synthase|nr:pseudouridine synthase [Bacteroidales bacterium]